MPVRNPYIEFLEEHFAPLGQITSRAMFGGHCLYCDGTVFGLVARNALFLKADGENREAFAERGLKPFRPFEDRDEVMSYYEAPPEVFENEDAMKEWVGGAVQAGLRSAKPRRRRKSTDL